jgi:hypothetical protein
MGSLPLWPGDSLTILTDGFVNRLQEFQFPSFLLFKLRGFDFFPGGTHLPLTMPAFAGRTLPRIYLVRSLPEAGVSVPQPAELGYREPLGCFPTGIEIIRVHRR